jgi:UV DNA damage endonuclease
MPSPRFGLCGTFRDQPIKFVTTTAAAIGKLRRPDAIAKLSRLCLANADALLASLRFCAENQIGCFRINSQVLPIKTNPDFGYSIGDLPADGEIVRRFQECGQFAQKHDLRTCFHPDQFVVLNSPKDDVVAKSIAELDYQAEVAGWVGADVINIHAGGAHGDKQKALADFARNLDRLSHRARNRLTVENDDTTFTPADLLPICKAEGVPLVYNVHHHRCNPDGMSVEQVTKSAMTTWDREPLFHISSPLEGWAGPRPHRHHDFIDPQDFPPCWRRKKITVEVEAEAKEVAVSQLQAELSNAESARSAEALEESWFVYLLRCADGSLYTGITTDVARRCEQHNSGTASHYTRSRRPVALVYQERQGSRSLALKREAVIKTLSRPEKESLVRLAG